MEVITVHLLSPLPVSDHMLAGLLPVSTVVCLQVVVVEVVVELLTLRRCQMHTLMANSSHNYCVFI